MRVLIATDGSEYGDAAVGAAAERPWPPDTEMRVLVVMERKAISYVAGEEYELDFTDSQLATDIRNLLEAIGSKASLLLKRKGLTTSHIVREGIATEEIINEAKEWRANLILVGTHGRHGIKRFLLGSVARGVATHAPCSVEIVQKST